jgi:hypothetical protein
MRADSHLLIHAPRSALVGTSVELRQATADLERDMPRILALFSRAARRTILGMMRDGKDHWFGAKEAKAAKLIDTIIPAPPQGFAPSTADAQSTPDGALLALAGDLIARLEAAAKNQPAFRAEIVRRLGVQ